MFYYLNRTFYLVKTNVFMLNIYCENKEGTLWQLNHL